MIAPALRPGHDMIDRQVAEREVNPASVAVSFVIPMAREETDPATPPRPSAARSTAWGGRPASPSGPRRPALPYSETSPASSLLDPGWMAKLLSREIGGTISASWRTPTSRGGGCPRMPPRRSGGSGRRPGRAIPPPRTIPGRCTTTERAWPEPDPAKALKWYRASAQ